MLIFQTLCFKTFKNEAKLLGDTDADGTKGTLDRRIFVLLALFRMDGERGGGGRQKSLPTSFSFVTSTSIGTSPHNFLTFRVNPFATLV